jgi:hypothetical protein
LTTIADRATAHRLRSRFGIAAGIRFDKLPI